jgi:hypothetical protein
VIDDDGQVALALAMRYLVDPDPSQAVQQIAFLLGLGGDTLDDGADGPPRDTHQLGDRGLARVDRQPRHLVLEIAREARVVTRPRDRADHHPVTVTAHPRRLGSTNASVVPRSSARQRPPAPPALTEIEPRAAAPAHATAITLAPGRADRDDELSLTANLHVLDDRPLDTQQPRPYPDLAHAVSAPLRSSPEEAGTLGAARRAPSISRSLHPREQQERRIFQESRGRTGRWRDDKEAVSTVVGADDVVLSGNANWCSRMSGTASMLPLMCFKAYAASEM